MTELPLLKQLRNHDVPHLRPRHKPYLPSPPHLDASEPQDAQTPRRHAKSHVQREELHQVPR